MMKFVIYVVIYVSVVLMFMIYVQHNFTSSVPSHHIHRYRYKGQYSRKFSKAYIESKTQIELADSEEARKAENEELNELKKFGIDVEFEDLVSWREKMKLDGGSNLKKPTENPMENENVDEIARERLAHDKDKIIPDQSIKTLSKTVAPAKQAPKISTSANKTSINITSKAASQNKISAKNTSISLESVNQTISSYTPKFRVRNPDADDLKKLSKKDIAIETDSDPLPVSPYCTQPVFLTILVVSKPESAERRKYIRKSWAFSYEDDHDKLKEKKSFPYGAEYTPKNVVRVVFVLGRSKNAKVMKSVMIEADIHKDLVFGNVDEHYRNLTMKTKLGLKWAYFECKTSYLLKTDDDVFINPVPLVEWLKEMPSIKFYAGWCKSNSPVVRDKKNKW